MLSDGIDREFLFPVNPVCIFSSHADFPFLPGQSVCFANWFFRNQLDKYALLWYISICTEFDTTQ